MSNSFLDRTWKEIEPAIHVILGDEKNSSLDSFMYTQTYTKVYDYCTAASSRRPAASSVGGGPGDGSVRLVGGELYAKLKVYLKHYLENLKQKEGESFLQFYIRTWERYLIGSTRLNDVLDYINRYWVTKERGDGHREIYDILSLCLLSWRDYKFHTNLDILMSEIMEQIRDQRLNKIESIGNLSVAIKSFVLLGFDVNDLKKQNLSVYINDFEKSFLTETYNFYAEESQNFIKEYGVVNYLVKAEQRIEEELKRLEELNDHTRRPLNDCLNEVLITNHADVIRSELTPLLDQERYSDIRRMHHLLKRVPMTIDPLLQQFQAYVRQQGLNAVEELKLQLEAQQKEQSAAVEEDGKSKSKKGLAYDVDAKIYIQTLLKVYHKFQNVVKESFENNEAFVKALDSACQSFINYNPIATPKDKSKSKTPDLLAKYADEMLRKKPEDMSVDELMTVFKFIDDKESFEVWYRRFLSKRLMGSTMTPEDGEREELIIGKLRSANTQEYTNKITNMFNDIRVSRDLGTLYKETIMLEPNPKDYVSDLEPRILDSGAWQSIFNKSNESILLPPMLINTQEKFASIYQSKFPGRQLSWIWNRSKVELKANISKPGKPPFLFTVTLFQMAILYPFNEADTLSVAELLEATAAPVDVFKANITPLVKNKLLIQNPPGEEAIAKPHTTFTIVKEYTSKRIKVNFASGVKIADSRNEEKDTNTEIQMRHHGILKASIVRVMKARKHYKHEQLTNEVYKMIDRFKPTVADIKKAIEVLIDEQYLARDSEGTGYEYLS
ncbi:hypothetical protein KL929_002218 [Ogataea haglerorum]|nr:hypothetical protein KL929_002218 [Ogataea haglerorum]